MHIYQGKHFCLCYNLYKYHYNTVDGSVTGVNYFPGVYLTLFVVRSLLQSQQAHNQKILLGVLFEGNVNLFIPAS